MEKPPGNLKPCLTFILAGKPLVFLATDISLGVPSARTSAADSRQEVSLSEATSLGN